MINSREVLIYLSIKYGGDWDKEMQFIRSKSEVDREDLEKTNSTITSNVVTMLDPEYPQALKNVTKPPLSLFYYGDLNLIRDERKCISYIGSREPSQYGSKMASEIAGEVNKEGYVIVSGLARGIDSIATEAALNSGGKAVAVLGSGIDVCYPSNNERLYERLKTEGLIISEYPLGTEPTRDKFPARNRIIAALSSTLVVGEAKQKSGTMITVSHALFMGKNICCLPFRADEDSFCNTLIREGAFLVENASEVMDVAKGIKT